MVFAMIAQFYSGLLIWTVVGLMTGWVTAAFLRSPGRIELGNVVAGLIGGLTCGLAVGSFGTGDFGFWGSNVASFVGACALVALWRIAAGVKATPVE